MPCESTSAFSPSGCSSPRGCSHFLSCSYSPASLLLVFLGLATIALSLSAQGLLSLIDNWLARLLGIEMPPLEGDETGMPCDQLIQPYHVVLNL